MWPLLSVALRMSSCRVGDSFTAARGHHIHWKRMLQRTNVSGRQRTGGRGLTTPCKEKVGVGRKIRSVPLASCKDSANVDVLWIKNLFTFCQILDYGRSRVSVEKIKSSQGLSSKASEKRQVVTRVHSSVCVDL